MLKPELGGFAPRPDDRLDAAAKPDQFGKFRQSALARKIAA
jgi:hypothetical protein